MKRWRVETRVTMRRVYFVDADNDHDAKVAIGSTPPDVEEDQDEETVDLTEIEPEGCNLCDDPACDGNHPG